MKSIVQGLCALVLIAGGAAFTAPPAAAQDSSARQRAQQAQTQKKAKAPAKKPVSKKPPPKKKPQQQAPRKPQARAPARPAAPAGPPFSTDTETNITAPGDHHFRIQHGGLARTYRVHVPPGYQLSAPAPLVVALHGGGGADLQANESYYGLAAKADREGFVAVFPSGAVKAPGGKLGTWNAGYCCGGARDQNLDDVGFIRQVVTNVFRQMSIDRGRIFAAGVSEGGMMAYRLACEMPEVFRAVVSVAATDSSRSCEPGNPVSVLHIHAKDDPQVPFAGGAAPDATNQPGSLRLMSVRDAAAKWAHLNGCAAQPRHTLDKAGAYCEAYSYCRGQAEVHLCVTDSGGHSWPGGKAARGVAPASQALSATDLMWEFFSRR